MNLFKKILLYILSFIFSPIGIITWIISLFSKDPEKKTSWTYLSLYRINLIYPFGRPRHYYFFHDDYHYYYRIAIERMIVLGEHPITKELRYIRICLVILIIVLLFFNSEKSLKFLQIMIP